MELKISVSEQVLVRDFIGVMRYFIDIALKLRRIVAEDIEQWQRANEDSTNVNGPPTLGVSVNDASDVKATFG